ncbi:MAG: hypothetical protein HZT43_17755 [Exiguobacterium profundum]|nr:MAG: hypothetical protein HZT43_17755 [Exiguobacterium profundum]
MLSQFGITVSRAGLARLFEVVAETRLQDGDIQQRRDLDRTRQFRIGGAAVQGLSGLEMLRVHIGSPIERVLPLADHGLSYAAGSRMMVDGLARRVESVLPAQRSLRMLTDNDRPVREYCFARDYAFPTEGGRPDGGRGLSGPNRRPPSVRTGRGLSAAVARDAGLS